MSDTDDSSAESESDHEQADVGSVAAAAASGSDGVHDAASILEGARAHVKRAAEQK